jgi:hypothetical protein
MPGHERVLAIAAKTLDFQPTRDLGESFVKLCDLQNSRSIILNAQALERNAEAFAIWVFGPVTININYNPHILRLLIVQL